MYQTPIALLAATTMALSPTSLFSGTVKPGLINNSNNFIIDNDYKVEKSFDIADKLKLSDECKATLLDIDYELRKKNVIVAPRVIEWWDGIEEKLEIKYYIRVGSSSVESNLKTWVSTHGIPPVPTGVYSDLKMLVVKLLNSCYEKTSCNDNSENNISGITILPLYTENLNHKNGLGYYSFDIDCLTSFSRSITSRYSYGRTNPVTDKTELLSVETIETFSW